MISVVETLDMLFLRLVDETCLEVFHRSVDEIIVVGIILEGVDFPCESVF